MSKIIYVFIAVPFLFLSTIQAKPFMVALQSTQDKEQKLNITKQIQGNWLRTDGSNEWVYGIYEDMVVFKSQVWTDISISSKGKNHHLILKKGSLEANIYIKQKGNRVLIGPSLKALEPYSAAKTLNEEFQFENNEGFLSEDFGFDTAIYRGVIKGYDAERMSIGDLAKTSNIITHERKGNSINISSEGVFEVKVPLLYPQKNWFAILCGRRRINNAVYLTPGKTTFQYIDITEQVLPNDIERIQKEYDEQLVPRSEGARVDTFNILRRNGRKNTINVTSTVFMGENARLNTNLKFFNLVNYVDKNIKGEEVIFHTTPEAFKKGCLDMLKMKLDTLDLVKKKYRLSTKAFQVKKAQMTFEAYNNIFSYLQKKSRAYKKKNKGMIKLGKPTLEIKTPAPEFYDFLRTGNINSSIALLGEPSYYSVIRNINSIPGINPKPNYRFVALNDSLKKRDLKLSKRHSDFLNQVTACENHECMRKVIQADQESSRTLINKYNKIWLDTWLDVSTEIKMNNLETQFGFEPGLISDVLYARNTVTWMKQLQRPLEQHQIDKYQENISNKFIYEYILKLNEERKRINEEIVEANKTKTGYKILTTPKVAKEQLFDTIMKRYKGKVVLVDFWATWCAPCRRHMEPMKEIKAEFKDKDVVFIYIAGENSREETWNLMVPDIKGDHFKVSEEQWIHFYSQFNITGIPHYMLVDKKGSIARNKIEFNMGPGFIYHPYIRDLKALIHQYLEE